MATRQIQVTDKKTDNSYLADKVGLRVNHLPGRGPVRVLDCFAGSGRIWRAVQRRSRREIQVLAMDVKNYGFHLPGDNLAWLVQMDLSRFDIIDLDAYGVPYEQLKILFDRHYQGMVFVTFIQLHVHSMPKDLLLDIGFTDAMYQKAPMLCCTRGWEYFLEWLGSKNVATFYHRSHHGAQSQWHYLCFILNGAG